MIRSFKAGELEDAIAQTAELGEAAEHRVEVVARQVHAMKMVIDD
jgi:hypothetical protein